MSENWNETTLWQFGEAKDVSAYALKAYSETEV
jgi:hypothetical protein